MPRSDQQTLKLRHLAVFLAAARHGNFAKASEDLHLSPAAVGQAISELEGDLGEGVKLFDRGQAGARITPQGQALIEHAERLLADAEGAKRAVRSLAAGTAATLEVCYEPLLARTAGAVIEGLMAKNPRLCVSAWERSPLEFSEVIGSRGVGLSHLIYWHGEELKPPSIDAEIIGTSSLACVVSARHPFARLEEVPLLSLENEPLALPWLPRDTRDLAGYIRPYFGAHKLAPRRVVYQGREVTALLDIVRAGHAVTVLPFAEDSDGHGLVAVKLAPTPPRRHIALMRKPGTAWSQTAQAFATEMRKRFPAFDPTSVSFVPREWAPSDEKKRDDTPSVAESVANATRDAALTQLAVERKVRDAKS